MSDFRHVVEIRAAPAHVWSVLLDVEHWPDWTTSVTKVKRMDIGPLTLGSRTRMWQPRLMPAVWQVTSLDEQRRVFGWTSRTLGMKCVAWHHVESVRNLSRVTLSIDYSGLLSVIVARIYRDLIWDYISREGNGLKKWCEFPAAKPGAAARTPTTAQRS
jgi:hypothetical protein